MLASSEPQAIPAANGALGDPRNGAISRIPPVSSILPVATSTASADGGAAVIGTTPGSSMSPDSRYQPALSTALSVEGITNANRPVSSVSGVGGFSAPSASASSILLPAPTPLDEPRNSGDSAARVNLSRHVTSVITHFTSSKDGYRRLISELDDFLFVLSPSGTFLFSSPSASKHLGVSPDLLDGRSVTDFLHIEDHELILHQLRKTSSETGGESVGERAEYSVYCRFKRNNGNMVLMDVKGKPFPYNVSEGPVKYFVHAAREYRSKGTMSIDSILELRLENLRLRRQLEETLLARGVDPLLHPLLRQDITEVAPSAHPRDLDIGGNLESSITEEDFSDAVGGDLPTVPGIGMVSGGLGSGSDTSAAAAAAVGSVSASTPSTLYVSTYAGSGVIGAGSGTPVSSIISADSRVSYFGASPIAGQPHFQPHSAKRSSAGDISLPGEEAGGTGEVKKKKKKIPIEDLFCRQCGTTNSPEWRKGPLGAKTLCNACGLAYSKKLSREKKRLQKEDGTFDSPSATAE